MKIVEKTCEEFVMALASSAPVPGGGGAAALVGAIGTALGNMVGALTVGKPKFAPVEAELRTLQKECDALQAELLALVDLDADGFAPLAAAYRIPKTMPHRDEILESATAQACDVPMKIMSCCCKALDAVAVFAEKGSRLAVSDAGCAALCCKAALQSASLNVFINTKALKDRELAQSLNSQADKMLAHYCPKADDIYRSVAESFR